MNQIVFASGEHLIAENLKTEFLTIGAGAVLKAPEGEYLALTVNGCVHPLAEGSYHGRRGDHRGRAPSPRRPYPSVRRKSPIPLEAAISVKNGKLVPAQGVAAAVQHGTVTDTQADDIFIAADAPDFAGIVVDGEGSYTINRQESAWRARAATTLLAWAQAWQPLAAQT